jgi:hypothetical protein
MVTAIGTSVPMSDWPYVALSKSIIGHRFTKKTVAALVVGLVAWRWWPSVLGVGMGFPKLSDNPMLKTQGISYQLKYYDFFKPREEFGTEETWELSQKMAVDAQRVLGYNTYPLIGTYENNTHYDINNKKETILITAEGWPDVPAATKYSPDHFRCYRRIVSVNFRDSGYCFNNGILARIAALRFFNLGGTRDQMTLMHTVASIYKAYPDAPLKLYGQSRGGGTIIRLLHALYEYDAYASWWKVLGCSREDVAKILANIKKGGVVLAKPAVNRAAAIKQFVTNVLDDLLKDRAPYALTKKGKVLSVIKNCLKSLIGGIVRPLAPLWMTIATDYHFWQTEAIDLLERLVAKKNDLSFVSIYCSRVDETIGNSQDERIKALAQTVVDEKGTEKKKQDQVKAGIGNFVVDWFYGHNENDFVIEHSKLFAI